VRTPEPEVRLARSQALSLRRHQQFATCGLSEARRRAWNGAMAARAASAEQYEALQEASERQHAVAAALASVRADGLEPSQDDLELFVQVAGQLTTDELRDRILTRYLR
jgi:hypothetical protein